MNKEKIFRDYHGKVHGYVASRIRNRQDAEDIVADVFVKIYSKLDTFDESKASISTWIYTVTRNTLIDFYRTRKVFVEIPETLSSEYSVEEEVCNAETLNTLADALESLDERERDVIILHYNFGKTLREIADKYCISYAYVKILQNKALEKIRKMLLNNSSHRAISFV